MNLRSGFMDSNDVTNSSGEANSNASEVTLMRLLSEHLGSILEGGVDFFSDAMIVAGDGREVAVHRCVLASRSGFFKTAFAGGSVLRLKEVANDYDVGLEALGIVLAYLYSGRVKALPQGGVCECVDDVCCHFGCRPAVDFLLQLLYVSSTFQLSELVALYHDHLLGILNKVVIDEIFVVLLVANICGQMCDGLLARCTEMIVKSDADITTLEKELPLSLVEQIMNKQRERGMYMPGNFYFPDKHVNRIHRALDSDDVELVRLLLKEGYTTLDDAYALHYAVAYCDVKTTTELLDLGLADVNNKNHRGYSVLHVAAMRKEPKIIVSLLTKGAQPSDLTLDGRNALQISKRLTKASDYYNVTEEGKVSCNDQLCIEILEQAERREPLLGEASLSLALAGDDLRMKLLYLENRVGLAKVLFPMEAKVIMDIAQIDGTSEFPSADICCPNINDSERTTVDLNDAPFKMKEEHLVRLRALSRTGENYDYWNIKMKTFFCSQDLWEIVEDGFTVPSNITTLTSAQKKEYKESKQKDSKALYFLQQAVVDAIFPRIMDATSAKEAWSTLQEEFQGSVKVRTIKLQTLRHEFELLNMKESETIKDYYSRIKEIVSQMRACGENILDKKIVEKILISIPHKYDAIVTTIEQIKDLSTLSVTELIGSLEAYEQRLKRYNDDSVENVFQSKLKLRSQNKESGEKKNGEISRNREIRTCGEELSQQKQVSSKFC